MGTLSEIPRAETHPNVAADIAVRVAQAETVIIVQVVILSLASGQLNWTWVWVYLGICIAMGLILRSFLLRTIHLIKHNFQVTALGHKAGIHWGIWHGQEIEGWGSGIRLLNEWGFFVDPTPRLGRIRWLRPIEAAIRTSRIYHFQLGKVTG